MVKKANSGCIGFEKTGHLATFIVLPQYNLYIVLQYINISIKHSIDGKQEYLPAT
jgi:hypothetical protein